MRRPPGRIIPILPRSPGGWANRVKERHEALAALGVTPDERRRLDAWLTSRFVFAALRLEEIDAARNPWAQGVEMAKDAAPFVAAHLTNAVRETIILARKEGEAARLTPELLSRLGGAAFRTRDDLAHGSTAQAPAAYLEQAIANACDWFAAESFMELSPIEQAAIVFLRLATVRPFEQANESAAMVAASLFTLRAGLPPVVIKPETQAAFREALVEAGQINMEPLVELIAEAIGLTLGEMIGWVEQARGE
jgi:hypothetical protein